MNCDVNFSLKKHINVVHPVFQRTIFCGMISMCVGIFCHYKIFRSRQQK